MAVNEMSLTVRPRTNFALQKILGGLALICAPSLFAFFLLGGTDVDVVAKSGKLVAFLGVLYIGGWICGAIGMFTQKAYGDTKAAKIIFTIQMIFLTLAFLFSIQETMGISYENGGGIFFGICDAGYPLSHLFMLAVFIITFRARVWRGFYKFAPLLVGLALPVTMLGGRFIGMTGGILLFGGLTMTGLGTIGIKLLLNNKS